MNINFKNCWAKTPSFQETGVFIFLIVSNKAKGRISKLVLQENKARQIFQKRNISYPLMGTRTCAHQEVRNVCFLGKFSLLCFLVTPVLTFATLPHYRQIVERE